MADLIIITKVRNAEKFLENGCCGGRRGSSSPACIVACDECAANGPSGCRVRSSAGILPIRKINNDNATPFFENFIREYKAEALKIERDYIRGLFDRFRLAMTMKQCSRCFGSGTMMYKRVDFGVVHTAQGICPACKGKGWINRK